MNKKDLKKVLASVSAAALISGAGVTFSSCGKKANESTKSGKSGCGQGSCGGKKADKKAENKTDQTDTKKKAPQPTEGC